MKKHLKRLNAPRTWKLARKEFVWAYKPRPGPHPQQRSLPIAHVLRGTLGLADTAREAEHVVFSRQVLVDGKPATDPKFPVGLMDVVSLSEVKAHYRMLVNRRGRMALVPLGDGEAAWKLCRIEDKTTVRGGKAQLNLHDGRNLLLPKDSYKTGTTLKVQLPAQKVLGHYELGPGVAALITGGKHVGEVAHVLEVFRTRNPRANTVTFKEGFSTDIDKVFVVGKEAPEVRTPEVSAL